jgi:hypothetical protein
VVLKNGGTFRLVSVITCFPWGWYSVPSETIVSIQLLPTPWGPTAENTLELAGWDREVLLRKRKHWRLCNKKKAQVGMIWGSSGDGMMAFSKHLLCPRCSAKLCVDSHLNSDQCHEKGALIVPILQTRKQKPRDVQELSEGEGRTCKSDFTYFLFVDSPSDRMKSLLVGSAFLHKLSVGLTSLDHRTDHIPWSPVYTAVTFLEKVPSFKFCIKFRKLPY